MFKISTALLEEMVLFRTRNGSIPHFIYGTLKWFYVEPFFGIRFYWPSMEPFFKSVYNLLGVPNT